jgi:hypothetical protein
MLYKDLKAFGSTGLSSEYLKTRREERRNLKFAARDFFLQKFTLINMMRAKFGYIKLDSSVIADFESAIEFDYIRIFWIRVCTFLSPWMVYGFNFSSFNSSWI